MAAALLPGMPCRLYNEEGTQRRGIYVYRSRGPLGPRPIVNVTDTYTGGGRTLYATPAPTCSGCTTKFDRGIYVPKTCASCHTVYNHIIEPAMDRKEEA